MTAIAAAFDAARADNRAALIGYLPAGFPSVEGAIAAIEAMIRGGVDIVELGLPYSDPLIDGPVIQSAVDQALRTGTTTADVLETVRRIAAGGTATLVMTYWNPIERYGVARFADDVAAAGGSGVIAPDLTPEEAGDWLSAGSAAGLDTVFLAAPSSTEARLRLVAEAAGGFIYAASTMGVTGERAAVSSRAAELVARLRAVTDKRVAVGLGVSSGAQAAEIAQFADGVIVGSAFVRCLLDAATPDAGIRAVEAFARELAEGVRARTVADVTQR
ncbi:MAG: tryptophan synthase subunit alpha [Mycobacteriales bacterium]